MCSIINTILNLIWQNLRTLLYNKLCVLINVQRGKTLNFMYLHLHLFISNILKNAF